MLYKINNSPQYEYIHGNYIPPMKAPPDELLVVFDPGKTNMAMIVGTIYGEIVAILEFSGKSAYNGLAIDTTDYCLDFMAFVKGMLADCKIRQFSQEKAILKNVPGYQHFNSQMVLTEIRANLIMLSVDMTGKKPREINNQEWKGAILPPGFNKRGEKGSKEFMKVYAPEFASYSHDVTDVICMYLYEVKKIQEKEGILCNKTEKPRYDMDIAIYDKVILPSDIKLFQFNDEFSCLDNATFYANRSDVLGACKLPRELISLDDLYKYAHYMFTDSDPYLLVKRR